jgi:hypothetical protein
MSFRPPSSTYRYSDFINYVKYWQGSTGLDLRIVCYVTNLDTEELVQSLRKRRSNVRILGEVFEVTSPYFKDEKELRATFYCYHDKAHGLVLAFTAESSEAVSKTLNEWVRRQPNVYYLWISPKNLIEIRDKIIGEHPNTIIPSFNAKRYPWNKFQNVIRGEYERSFEYHGDDGRFTLQELQSYYGILPTAMDFFVPKMAKFRMTNDGLFTFKEGNLDFVFGVINEALGKGLSDRRAIEETKYEFIPLSSGKKTLQLLNVVPLSVRLGRDIGVDDADSALAALSKNDFEVYDVIKEAGSLHFSGTLFDKQNGATVEISGNSEKFTLTPHGAVPFDSMLRIYRTLSDYVNVETSIGSPA